MVILLPLVAHCEQDPWCAARDIPTKYKYHHGDTEQVLCLQKRAD
jgi:hypothetical protein